MPVGPQRFAFLPLPSIEGRGEGGACVAGRVRRALVTTFADGCSAKVEWARRALSGGDLVDERTKESVALLSLVPASDSVAQRYLKPASAWATVTPVVLPGYDDPSHYRRRLDKGVGKGEQRELLERLGHRIDGLLRKAIIQAGFSKVLAEHADLEWRKSGFWAGNDLAHRYAVPGHLTRFPRLHVLVRWRSESGAPISVPGPVCLGGGRFLGVGLFASLDRER